MASLRFSSFGAATVPLSKIIVDKDLDLRPHGVIARYCRAPVEPTVWATEEISWGDVAPHEETLLSGSNRYYNTAPSTVLTATRGEYVTIRVTVSGGNPLNVCNVLINDTTVFTHGFLNTYQSVEYTGFINAGDVVSIDARTQTSQFVSQVTVVGIFSGMLGGPKTFDLTGKWLALGIDMKGLAATVKIQGVEMPYSDYAKYFPLAPTELKFPGGWSHDQVRPIIEVYK